MVKSVNKDILLREIKAAWLKEDREAVKRILHDAFYLKVDKKEILNSVKELGLQVNEDFAEWAYMFVVTEGNSDCTPG